MCQKDAHVADMRKTHRELDQSGLEEDTGGCRRAETQNQLAEAWVHLSTQGARGARRGRGRRRGRSLRKAKSVYTLFSPYTHTQTHACSVYAHEGAVSEGESFPPPALGACGVWCLAQKHLASAPEMSCRCLRLAGHIPSVGPEDSNQQRSGSRPSRPDCCP